MKTLIEVTHANLNSKIHVVSDLLYAWYYSEAHKATLLLASGGAMLPVKESCNEVEAKIAAVRTQTQETTSK